MVTPGPPDVEPDATSDADDAVDVVSTDEAASADVATGEMAAPDLAADSAAPVEVDTAETSRPTGAEAALLPKSGRLLYVTLPGLWGALLASCLSFTPSLLPRTGTIQGAIWGISAAIGYGIGVLIAWIWRAFADREPWRPRRRSLLILAYGGGALLVAMFALGQYWQSLLRDLLDVTEYNIWLVVASPLIAAIVFGLLIAVGRGIRGIYRWLAKLLSRWVGPRGARATAWIAAAAVTYLVISGLLLNGLVALINEAFSVENNTTPPGIHQPTSSLRSGGPGSLVSWNSLGKEGRKFVATGPTAADIGSFTHTQAMEPIRAYAGVESADNTEDRAALAVSDLERAGGFQRKNLLVFTTTGSGWVDPASADTFEYLSDGDSAIVTIQYSYLPSWLSYLVDQKKAREAGRDLFDTVYDKWSQLPQNARPKLYVGGESLGTYGAESAFSGEYDLSNLTSGALFAGPPNFNTLFREFSDNRDAGSLESLPVYKDGRIVRFSNDPEVDIPPDGQPWNGTRVLYLMHPSDPIVWWDWSLGLNKPDWTSEPPGSDVLKQAVWIPLLTFWQVTGDLPFATGVPAGHGHTYKSEYVDGWNAVMRAGLTPGQLESLRTIISGVNQE
jgi:uncharacterized membrane protein